MRDQRGFALTELLIAILLMTIVVGATLTAYDKFQGTNERALTQNDSQEQARTAMDQIVRDLRNGASPSYDPTTKTSTIGIATFTATDLVFQAVDPTGASGGSNVRHASWVRYCLDTSTPTNEKLWRSTMTYTSATRAAPTSSVCPDDSTWSQTPKQLVADHLVNTSAQPLFTFNLPAGSTDSSQISRIGINLYVNFDPRRNSQPTELQSAVYLRDQVQAPHAAFTYQVTGSGVIYLNASSSTDDAGFPLTYDWCDTTSGGNCAGQGSNGIGAGLTLSYDAPSGTRTITLTATDPAGVSNSTSQQVVVP